MSMKFITKNAKYHIKDLFMQKDVKCIYYNATTLNRISTYIIKDGVITLEDNTTPLEQPLTLDELILTFEQACDDKDYEHFIMYDEDTPNRFTIGFNEM